MTTALAPTFADPTRARLFALLSTGIPPGAAARAVGVTPSYISQLLAEDESFAEAVATARMATLEEDVSHDNTVKTVEAKSLKLISDRLGQVKSAMDAARIFQILNNSKRRTEEAAVDKLGEGPSISVTLNIPAAAAPLVTARNAQGEIIEIGGRSLATAPASKIADIRSRLLEREQERVRLRLDQVRALAVGDFK
jgi:DNA-binding transcriptional ArsR family regulator